MLENPLKEVLVKKSAGGFLDMLGSTNIGSEVSLSPMVERDFYSGPSFTETLQKQITPAEELSFRDGAELIEHLSKDPDAIRYLDDAQDLLGKDVKLQDVLKSEQALTDFARNRIYKRYGLQNYSTDQLSKLNQSDKSRVEQEIKQYVELVKNTLSDPIRSSLEKVYKNTQVPTQPALTSKETTPVANSNTSSPAATPTQNPLSNTINISDFSGTPSVDEALAIAAQGVDGKPAASATTGVANTTAPASIAASAQQEVPESASKASPQSKSTDAKKPLISIEQARGLLAKGIAPTSIGGYSQTLGADGTNSLAQQELELMDEDPTYNPFANTQAKYVQNLNKMRLLDRYNPETIMAENQRIRQNQAKLDADRRSRMNAAQYYAGQGVQGARDYHNYMTRGGQLSQAGQQWRDNFDVTGWNRQQQANKTKFRTQQPTTNPVQVQAPLGVGPRPVAEQASMRKALGHADTGVGIGSHAAADAYNAASNKANGLSGTISANKFPVSVAPPNNGTTHTSTTSTSEKIYTKPTVTQTKTAFVKNPFTNTK